MHTLGVTYSPTATVQNSKTPLTRTPHAGGNGSSNSSGSGNGNGSVMLAASPPPTATLPIIPVPPFVSSSAASSQPFASSSTKSFKTTTSATNATVCPLGMGMGTSLAPPPAAKPPDLARNYGAAYAFRTREQLGATTQPATPAAYDTRSWRWQRKRKQKHQSQRCSKAPTRQNRRLIKRLASSSPLSQGDGSLSSGTTEIDATTDMTTVPLGTVQEGLCPKDVCDGANTR
ncbi:hypothetical protein MKZ38_001683 [Zalerion maritima]|uniref:Uncharacterized protein n=1 Tax=Zalerion maritima TaxID=339359 RepID=A0AAD5RQ05_9PEZI|nr:hypothetical protein MKZ38_001683 [Zalerion maritima]